MKIRKQNLWNAFEATTGGIPSVWRELMGTQFDIVSSAFFQALPEPCTFFPCRKCGCSHDVTIHGPDDIVAVCSCEPWNCDELVLSAADIEILVLNWAALGRALAKAFGLDSRSAELSIHNTRQIGSWSADAVPVILTIQRERSDLDYVAMSLASRLRRPFILLAPTSENLDANIQEILARVGAEFFALDSHMRLTERGTFQPIKAPGEIFARFRPEPKEALPEDDARRVFAVVEQLDSEFRKQGPSVLTVLRMYCMEELSAAQIARSCRCSKTAVMRRLAAIRAKTGSDPKNLRRLSPYLNKVQEDL